MKFARLSVVATAFALLATCRADARTVRKWTDAELFEKSQLVVVATPIRSTETKGHLGHPEFQEQPVIGVETKLAVTAVLKGTSTIKTVVLYHFRADRITLPNAPTFISFNPNRKQAFRLFLVRQREGRYVPAAGQTDPALSVQEVTK